MTQMWHALFGFPAGVNGGDRAFTARNKTWSLRPMSPGKRESARFCCGFSPAPAKYVPAKSVTVAQQRYQADLSCLPNHFAAGHADGSARTRTEPSPSSPGTPRCTVAWLTARRFANQAHTARWSRSNQQYAARRWGSRRRIPVAMHVCLVRALLRGFFRDASFEASC